MIIDQGRAVNDRARISSKHRLVMLTREELEFLQKYRRCSPDEKNRIFMTLCGDDEGQRTLPPDHTASDDGCA